MADLYKMALGAREEKVKKALRIKHSELDDEIRHLVGASEDDLKIAGVNAECEVDIIDQAVVLYCKWMFDFRGKGEEYRKAYERLRTSMSVGGVLECRPGKRPSFYDE